MRIICDKQNSNWLRHKLCPVCEYNCIDIVYKKLDEDLVFFVEEENESKDYVNNRSYTSPIIM